MVSHNKTHPISNGGYLATALFRLSALLFLYDAVLHQPLGWVKNVERAKRPARLPVVLTREEVQAILAQLSGTYRLMADLLYGAGLRLMECVRLRVKDMVDKAVGSQLSAIG